MPIKDIVRYISIISGLRYKFDNENGIITFADPCVVLHEHITQDYTLLYENYKNETGKGGNINTQNFKRHLASKFSVNFDAGSNIIINNGRLLITNSYKEHEKINLILEVNPPAEPISEDDPFYFPPVTSQKLKCSDGP